MKTQVNLKRKESNLVATKTTKINKRRLGPPNYNKTINKMERVHSYLSIIILGVNVSNSLVKRYKIVE